MVLNVRVTDIDNIDSFELFIFTKLVVQSVFH